METQCKTIRLKRDYVAVTGDEYGDIVDILCSRTFLLRRQVGLVLRSPPIRWDKLLRLRSLTDQPRTSVEYRIF